MGKIDRGWIVRRDDHPHPDPRLVVYLIGKAEGHPHAAVRGRIPGQRPAVQRDAVPGDALHVRHMGIVIHVRAVVDLFIPTTAKTPAGVSRPLVPVDTGARRIQPSAS